jgi:Xaa-Pro aminopeptidase
MKSSRIFKAAVLVAAAAGIMAAGPAESLRDRARRDRLNRYLLPAMRRAGVDTWVVITREHTPDPVSFDVAADRVIGRAVCIFHDEGNALARVAICAGGDEGPLEDSGLYDRVIPYGKEGAAPHVEEEIGKMGPKKIAVDSSREESLADGLTVGNLEWFRSVIGPDLGKLLTPAEPVIVGFRSRKTPEEIDHYRAAVQKTESILREALTPEHVVAGKTTEKDLAAWISKRRSEMGLLCSGEPDQDPSVMAGFARGRSSPTDQLVAPGHVIRIDFGVDDQGYRTQVGRMAYVLRPAEKRAPDDVQRAFDTALAANKAAIAALKPGVTGLAVDQAARAVVTGADYPEYEHATGYPIGFFLHDIGPILGPDWPDRYGKKVRRVVLSDTTFVVEPSVTTPIASVGGPVRFALGEDVVVTDQGAEYLGAPQTQLILIPPAAPPPAQ